MSSKLFFLQFNFKGRLGLALWRGARLAFGGCCWLSKASFAEFFINLQFCKCFQDNDLVSKIKVALNSKKFFKKTKANIQVLYSTDEIRFKFRIDADH